MAVGTLIEPVADPRLSFSVEKPTNQIQERVWGLTARVDPTVTFEEYQYWAEIERAEEHEANRKYVEKRGPMNFTKVLKNRFSKGIYQEEAERAEKEKKEHSKATSEGVVSTPSSESAVTQEEWKTAARALRTASWGTIFYLITTDILGWASCPYVFSQVGWGMGVALYVIFGIAAAASGWMIWKVFLGLDSTRYPMQSFGDTYYRIFGPFWRHMINVFQALQQFMTVAVLILANAQIIAQWNARICFMVCMVIVMIVCMIVGSIRSLQRLGWLCNVSVWLNIVSFLIVMIACANFDIDYPVITKSTLIKTIEPVVTFAGPPPDQYQQSAYGTAATMSGVNSMVYSYGGALLFVAFLAEMRHPWDFWKGMLCAQSFICIVYIFFGAFVYGHFGQYSASNITQAIHPVTLQTAGNVFTFVTGLIACFLYFNIGMKTVYIEVFQEILKFPEITTKKGRWMWYTLGPLYWILAFIVAAAVPNLNGISSLVGALLILNFTYTFPAFMYVGYRIQTDAKLPGEGFDPSTRTTTRHDNGWQRWLRGFRVSWHINTINVLYGCGGLACCGMGCWSAIESLIALFGPGGTVATSFGCAQPV
ncbi:hypothetical protein VMCG_01359 [Cytospora schulzeri]|uniref:Amino acid transporter transmembrane domain-containing protein n=1 Tax=Cytospora schulzeri TaxID=448051 RepID=A0A423X6Q6_9PEZI|nr:hypothetical protein VMCG_01359 [Valsa malicola]